MIDTGQEENWPCRFEIKSPPRFLGYARWSNIKGERNVDARGHVVVVVALESRGSPVELLDELENCSHPRSGNGRRYKSAAVPSPSLPLLLPPILKLNSHFSYDSLLSFGSRERTRQFRYSSCGARNDGSSIGGEESKTLAPAFLQPGMRAARCDFTMRVTYYRVVFFYCERGFN